MEGIEERSAPIGMGFLTEASLQKGDTGGRLPLLLCEKTLKPIFEPLQLSLVPADRLCVL